LRIDLKKYIIKKINKLSGGNTMEITDIRIKKRDGDGRLKAIVSVTFDNEFVIHDVKIIEGNSGTDFIAMPSRKTPDGEYKDIAHPIHAQAREKLEVAIFEKYAEVKAAAAEALAAMPAAEEAAAPEANYEDDAVGEAKAEETAETSAED